jgi:tRNA A-37 threonylcarbamoyl transferase component Bud32
MAEIPRCPGCEAELATDAPEGLCPQCLYQGIVEGQDEAEGPTPGRTPPPAFVPLAAAELGRHFPQLEILQLLGQGGMGAVYQARQTKLDRLVAVKILPPEVARDPAFAERFTREAQALARLNHPNIVTVYDFGDVDGLYFFTMEFVDGHNLRDLLQAGALPADQTLAIVPQLCDALQYAHDEGLVHRDIKPENILLDKKGHVKIADFGLARLVGLTPTYLTLTGTHEVMGTLLYMAPEQMKRTHTVDHRADIYSLGVVLYEMLTGELPLGRFAPPSHKAVVDERLDQVVLRALAREPAERYQDAGAFKRDVEAALAATTTGAPGYVNVPRAGHRPATMGRQAWPPARFETRTEAGDVAVRGLISRDEEALVLEFEFAKASLLRKFSAYLKEPGRSHELRIPLHEIAWLSPGWGWGRPPRSLLLRVTRLSALAGMPETNQGEVQLFIPRADRPAARRLIESIAQATFETGGPDPTGDHARARWEIGVAATGLLVSGVLTLVFWALVGLVLAAARSELTKEISIIWLVIVAVASILIIGVSGLLIAGAMQMLRLHWYPLAATAAIVAMIPWSPAWLVSLPFGIWACIVLGRPVVAEAFFSAERGVGLAHAMTPKSRGFVAGRFLSLVHSMARYMMITLPGRKSVAAGPQGEQSSTQSRVPTPTVDYAGEPRKG